jgi:hypothetical protein
MFYGECHLHYLLIESTIDVKAVLVSKQYLFPHQQWVTG